MRDTKLPYLGFSLLTVYSYALDWAVYIVVLVVFMVYGSRVMPRAQEFSLADIMLMASYIPEPQTQVRMPALVLMAVGVPVAAVVVLSILEGHRLTGARKAWDVFSGMLALCGGMAGQIMFTCTLKNICGFGRPDLLARCEPDDSVVERLATLAVCTGNERLVREGFRSFPSGHTSTIFCGMTVASLTIAAKTQMWDGRGVAAKSVVAALPLVLASFVGCTRISDHRHFLRDVVAGASVGVLSGVTFYTQYFPWIWKGGRARPPRRWAESGEKVWSIRDVVKKQAEKTTQTDSTDPTDLPAP